MIVSFSRKFIFVHTPKTAGESITLALLPFLSAEDLVNCPPLHMQPPALPTGTFKHAPLRAIRSALGPGAAELFSFGFVRNPWDRVVSYFYSMDRKQFARHVDKGNPHKPCWHWAQDLDFVGRFESLERDFARICERLCIDARLGHVNASQRGAYRGYFDGDLRTRVAERFADDVREFGYEF